MKDYSELKMLADACPPPGIYHYQSKEWSNLMAFHAEVEDIYESDVGMAKELIDEVNRLKAEVESLKKDAARYRFGVDNNHWTDAQVDYAMSNKE